MKTPEKLYIVMFGFHTAHKRPTIKFSNIAEKGIIYTAIPKDTFKDTQNTKPEISSSNKRKLSIEFPPELIDKVLNGEVILMRPKGGIPIYAGKDVIEKIEQMDAKKRRQGKHAGRTWRKE